MEKEVLPLLKSVMNYSLYRLWSQTGLHITLEKLPGPTLSFSVFTCNSTTTFISEGNEE